LKTVLVTQWLLSAHAKASSLRTVLTRPEGGGMSDDTEDISLFALSMTSSSSLKTYHNGSKWFFFELLMAESFSKPIHTN